MTDLSGVTSVIGDTIPVIVTAGVAQSFLPRGRKTSIRSKNRKEKSSFAKAEAEAKRLRKEHPDLTVNVKEISPGNFGVRFSPKNKKDKFNMEYPSGHIEARNIHPLTLPKMRTPKIPKIKPPSWGKMRKVKAGCKTGYTRKRR